MPDDFHCEHQEKAAADAERGEETLLARAWRNGSEQYPHSLPRLAVEGSRGENGGELLHGRRNVGKVSRQGLQQRWTDLSALVVVVWQYAVAL